MKRDLIGAARRVMRSLHMDDRARGDAARDARDWSDAIDAYEAHLATNVQDTAIWIQLGHAYKEDGDLENALRAYLRAETLNSEDADLLLNLGHLYKMMGRIDPAMKALERSIALRPELFGGAAMIAREQIFGRVTWRDSHGIAPNDLTNLLAAVDDAEHGGLRVFTDYYASFGMR